jgi:site-specific DNA-methyltransferase (adenine-specific)
MSHLPPLPYTLHHADCFKQMQQLEDDSIDALITDPPYGLTNLRWDTKIDWPLFWNEAHRVCKQEAVIVLFSQQPFTTDLIASNRRAFRYELIWHKSNAVGWLSAKHRPLRAHENILVFAPRFQNSTYNPQKEMGFKPYRTTSRGIALHYGKRRQAGTTAVSLSGERFPRSVLRFSNSNRPSLHPTQKPLELLLWLVRTYSKAGDVVLDPFMGSGTTGCACLQTGRGFIGIEREEEYFQAAEMRLGEVEASVASHGSAV